jgi:Tfp pilus assembly protein PilF
MAQGKYWDAIQNLELLIPTLVGEVRRRARLLRAREYMKNPSWTRRAENELQSILRDDPEDFEASEARVALAELYEKNGVSGRAIMVRKTLPKKKS